MTHRKRGLQKLTSLKGFPEQIRPTVACVCATEHILPEKERWEALRDCLAPKLLALPGRPGRSPENLISAQALPTSQRLGLIEGKKGFWRSGFYGRKLHNDARDPSLFRLKLGKRLLDLDKEEWGIIEASKSVEEYVAQRIPLHELALALAIKGIDACEDLRPQPPEIARRLDAAGITWKTKAQRLSDMLQYFSYSDIVSFERKHVRVLRSRIVEINRIELHRPEETVTFEEFAEELIRVYDKLSTEVFHSPYIPIKGPLMEDVCDSLNIAPDHFTKLLLALPSTFLDRQILLSPYRKRLPSHEVIQKGRQQYYLISMYTTSEESGGESS